METLNSVVVDPLENVFDKVGAMQGTTAPLKRAAIGAALGYAFVKVFQPTVAIDPAGNELPWKATSKAANATWFPAWMFSAVPAFIFGVLI